MIALILDHYARLFIAVFLAWVVALVVLGVTFLAANACGSESCNGTWFLSLILLAYTALAGLVVVPLGVASAAHRAKQREAENHDESSAND